MGAEDHGIDKATPDGDRSDTRWRGPAAIRAGTRRRVPTAAGLLAAVGLVIAVPMVLVSLVPSYQRERLPDDADLSDMAVSQAYPASAVTGSGPVGSDASASPRRSSPARRSSAPSSAPATLAPTTYEAESPANSLGGSAWVAPYPGSSGGRIVRNLGDWNSRQGDGWLRFNAVSVPADGTYTLTLLTVHLDGESARTVVISLSAGGSTTVTLRGGSTCCGSNAVRVQLRRGTNAITFGNPAGHAPSIDKIIVGSG